MNAKIFGFAIVAAGLTLASVLSGCGKNGSNTSAIGPVTTFPGTTVGPIVGRYCFQGLQPCVVASQFESTCRYAGGYITNRYGATPVCVITRRYEYWTYTELSLYYSQRLPILTPSIPTGGIGTQILLRKGAKLSYFSLGSGKWGYYQQPSSTTWGGIHFSWFKSSCTSVDWDGNGSGGQLMNEGQPAGLFGSDGIESFFLGAGTTTKTVTIHNDGYLRIGINADPNTPFGCTSPGYPEIDQTTCEDAAGNTYTCS